MKKVLFAIIALAIVAGCSSPTQYKWQGQGYTFDQAAQKAADGYWDNPMNSFHQSGFAPSIKFYYDDNGVQTVGRIILIRSAPGWIRPFTDLPPAWVRGHSDPPNLEGDPDPPITLLESCQCDEGDPFPPHKGDPEPPHALRTYDGDPEPPNALREFTLLSGGYTLEEFEDVLGPLDEEAGGSGGGQNWRCRSFIPPGGFRIYMLCVWHNSSGWACHVGSGWCPPLPTTYYYGVD